MTQAQNPHIAIIGLGYVGLPLAAHLTNAFGEKYPVAGFAIKQPRIDELRGGRDSTREVEPAELAESWQTTPWFPGPSNWLDKGSATSFVDFAPQQGLRVMGIISEPASRPLFLIRRRRSWGSTKL